MKAHDWENIVDKYSSYSWWRCKSCGMHFRKSHYDNTDISETRKAANIPEECS